MDMSDNWLLLRTILVAFEVSVYFMREFHNFTFMGVTGDSGPSSPVSILESSESKEFVYTQIVRLDYIRGRGCDHGFQYLFAILQPPF